MGQCQGWGEGLCQWCGNPLPPCENSSKSTENGGNNASHGSDKGVVSAHTLRRHRQWHNLSAHSICPARPDTHGRVATSGTTVISIPQVPPPAPTHSTRTTRKWHHQIPQLQKLRKQSSRLRSYTLCPQGLAQRQDAVRPHAVPLSLPLGVPGAREGPAPSAQVASELALPCPSPGAFNPLRGVDTLPYLCPSRGGVLATAALVMPRAKRPLAAVERPLLEAEFVPVLHLLPWPRLCLLGVEILGELV